MSFETLVKQSEASANRGKFEQYYNGESRLSSLGVTLPPKVRLLEMVVNWPRLTVDSVAERMIPEGFRLAAGQTDDDLWSVWQANNLDEDAPLLHTETLVQGRGFIIVGPGEDVPAVTVHSADGMALRSDPLTRQPVEALRRYKDAEGRDSAAHYEPNSTTYRVRVNGMWKVSETVRHNLGAVPVVPMTNRARIGDVQGRSEMIDVIGLTDAASRTLTNMQVAQELLAMPQRYVVGASASDFEGDDGSAKSAWDAYIGHMMTLENENAKPGQFPGADLRIFIEVINSYARQVSTLTGLPMHYLGFSSENPASAEAIQAAEQKLVTRVAQKQVAFGGAWEQAMRVALRFMGRGGAERLEMVWRDPSTPTAAAQMSSAVAGLQSGIFPVDMAREMVGMSAEQRKIAAELDHVGGFLPGALGVANADDGGVSQGS